MGRKKNPICKKCKKSMIRIGNYPTEKGCMKPMFGCKTPDKCSYNEYNYDGEKV